jgi:hypothetical protein
MTGLGNRGLEALRCQIPALPAKCDLSKPTLPLHRTDILSSSVNRNNDSHLERVLWFLNKVRAVIS